MSLSIALAMLFLPSVAYNSTINWGGGGGRRKSYAAATANITDLMSDISTEIDYLMASLIRRKALNNQQPPTPYHLYPHF